MVKKSRKKYEEQNDATGSVPEFGAIFMSSSATKRECLKRRLFGLPAPQFEFVKQVKAGMVLFLFEFESRELHGVFQACSDGAMNIVPHAFNSSAKPFPAQVAFTRMWHCEPLCEDDFRDAIRENYFSAKKFNFGLSEVQVLRLLSLFSLKKVEKQSMQRPSPRTEVVKSIGHSADDSRRAARDNRLLTSSAPEHNVAADHLLDFQSTYLGDSFGNSRRTVNDGKLMANPEVVEEHGEDFKFDMFTRNDYLGETSSDPGREFDSGRMAVSDRMRNEFSMDSNYRTDAPTIASDYSLNNIGRVPDNLRRALRDRLEDEYHEKDDFAPIASSGYPCSWSNLNLSADHSKKAIETGPLIIGPARLPLKYPHSIDSEIHNSPYPRFQTDATISNTVPYDPEAPSVDFRSSSSFGVHHNSVSAAEHTLPCGSYTMDTLPSSKIQLFPQSLEPRGASQLMDVNHVWGDYVPLPDDLGEYSTRTSVPGVAFSESMRTRPFDSEGHRGLSRRIILPNPLAPMETGSRTRLHVSPSYSSCPSMLPCFAHPSASDDKVGHKMLEYENNRGFVRDAHGLDSNLSQLQDRVSCAERETQKTRTSVFARLAKPLKECDTKMDYQRGDRSVDEVMSMLHLCRKKWAKTNKFGSSTKPSDFAGGFRKEKQKSYTSELLEEDLMMGSTETSINDIQPGDENDSQIVQPLPFVDFKRRSKVRRTCADGQNQGCENKVENPVSSTCQHKRRKLIRPNFSRDEQPKRESMDNNSHENASVSPVGTSSYKNNAGVSKVLTPSFIDKNRSSPKVESSHVGGLDC